MIDFEKFFAEHRAEAFDSLTYFIEKAGLLREILEFYTEECTRLIESLKARKKLTPYEQKLRPLNRIDDEPLMNLFERFLNPSYAAPVGDFNEMQVHLLAMYMLFECVPPSAISQDQKSQLDLSSLKLIAAAMYSGAVLPYEPQKRTSRSRREEIGDVNAGAVNVAFQASGAQWQGGKDPILYKDKGYSFYSFARVLAKLDKDTKLLPKKQRTIEKHLRDLFRNQVS
jgi:hypothetical protein